MDKNLIKKYICFGGIVISKDGDEHKISASRIAELNGLNPVECYFADEEKPETYLGLPKNLLNFHPRNDGKYKLKT